jgi:glycosyltransferase involved in cell wall biosynthesis
MQKNKPVIHFWVPYPVKVAPSQRFRVELFLPLLKQQGFSFQVLCFFDLKTWNILYVQGKHFSRFIGTVKGFFRRVNHLFRSVKADYIFINREAAPLGPPVFEWMLAYVFRKKIIYDFDDAIWIPGSGKIGFLKKLLKSAWKVKYIIKWAHKVAGGNEFLCNYARQYNSNVFIIPTIVDTDAGHNKLKNHLEGNRIIVGWTGSHTTLQNLSKIEELIKSLKTEMDFGFLIISNRPPDWNFDFIFQKWDEKTESDDLLKMHIGIMPSEKGPWFEGKCGFKLIQYQACGIPTIASPVGVNSLITLHEKTGFLASNNEEWKNYLKRLITDTQLRVQMGKEGRKHIEEKYSLNSQRLAFISLFS